MHEDNRKRDVVGARGLIQAVRGEGKAKAVHEKALSRHHGMIQNKESDASMTRESEATSNTQLQGCRRKTEANLKPTVQLINAVAEALRSGKDRVTAFGYVMHCMREPLLDFDDVSNEQGEDIDADEVEETMSLARYRARRHR